MLVTVDIDYDDWIKVSKDLLIGLEYGLKPIKIVKSPSRKGYHVVWKTHSCRVNNINFELDTPSDLKQIVKERLETAEKFNIRDKKDVLRVVLGDDVFRVIYDIKRRDIMPQQVLFCKSNYYRRRK